MERLKDLPVPDGEQPKSDVQIVSKASVVVAAHVRDLEEKLERSEVHAEAIRQEMVAMKQKSEAAQASRDKEFEMLRKKTEEQDAKYAQLLAILGASKRSYCILELSTFWSILKLLHFDAFCVVNLLVHYVASAF